MPWTAPKTFVAGTVLPASDLNTHLRDQLLVLRAGGIAVPGQAPLDLFYAVSSTQMGLIPFGSAEPGHALRVNDAGTGYELGHVETFLPGDPVSLAYGVRW